MSDYDWRVDIGHVPTFRRDRLAAHIEQVERERDILAVCMAEYAGCVAENGRDCPTPPCPRDPIADASECWIAWAKEATKDE